MSEERIVQESNKRLKIDSPSVITNETDKEEQFTPRGVDIMFLTALQNELKYQVHSLWRQLNVVETYNDSDVVDGNEVIIAAEEYRTTCSTDQKIPWRCCLKCHHHCPDHNFAKHMKESHGHVGEIRNWHSVPVLEMDHANSLRRVSAENIRKVDLSEYILYCRICCSSIERSLKHGNVHESFEQHFKSPRHKTAVKLFLNKAEHEGTVLPAFVQLIQGKFDASQPVEKPSSANLYHPHEFLLNCCCRSAVCRYCDTPPYIFSIVIPPNTKLIHCQVCNSPFATSLGTHFQDIQGHVKSNTHCVKRRETLVRNGYIAPDTQLFVASKT